MITIQISRRKLIAFILLAMFLFTLVITMVDTYGIPS